MDRAAVIRISAAEYTVIDYLPDVYYTWLNNRKVSIYLLENKGKVVSSSFFAFYHAWMNLFSTSTDRFWNFESFSHQVAFEAMEVDETDRHAIILESVINKVMKRKYVQSEILGGRTGSSGIRRLTLGRLSSGWVWSTRFKAGLSCFPCEQVSVIKHNDKSVVFLLRTSEGETPICPSIWLFSKIYVSSFPGSKRQSAQVFM